MIVQCTKCTKKFHKKPEEVSYIETKPYCKKCYGVEVYFRRLRKNAEKDSKKK